MISWICRKQASIAQSSTKAGYIVATMGARESVWLRKFLFDLFCELMKWTTIHYDNQSCIELSVNLVFHDRSKHIEIPYHYVRDMVERRAIQLEYVNTGDQIADVLTKALPKVKVDHFRKKLGFI